VDADARLLWRFPPRRLEAEALRDAILTVSGALDRRMGGPGYSPFEPNTNYVRVYQPRERFGPDDWRRMVYQQNVRMELCGTFGAFDCPDGGQAAPQRNRSTTPIQALHLLNGPFLQEQAERVARRLEREAGADPEAQAVHGFRLAFQRDPDGAERAAAAEVVRRFGAAALGRALFNASELLYLE
jgi:hypothetical protein